MAILDSCIENAVRVVELESPTGGGASDRAFPRRAWERDRELSDRINRLIKRRSGPRTEASLGEFQELLDAQFDDVQAAVPELGFAQVVAER